MSVKFFDPTLVRTPDQAVEFIGSILESSTEHSIIGEDLEGHILLWNEGACRLYGHKPEDVVGKANSRLLHTERGIARGQPEEMRAAALRTGHWEGTVASRRKDGSEFSAVVVLTLRRDAAGRPVGFLLMSRNADRASAELHLTEPFDSSIVGTMDLERAVRQFALQQAALDTAAGMFITDHNGIIRWVNAAFTTTTGFTAEEAIGSTPRILRSHFHSDKFYEDFWREIRSGRVWRGEFVNRRKDGTIYHDQHVVTPVRGPDGAITHYVAIMHDVTEQRTVEQQLRVAHREMLDLLEHSPAVLYALTIKGNRIEPRMVSENVTRLLGYPVAETMSREWWITHIHPDDQPRAEASLAETMANGTSQTEYRIVHRDGSYRWVEDSRRLVRDSSGAPVELAGVWADITDRKEAQEVSKETERRLRDMLDNLDLISLTIDCEGKVTYCNDYFLTLTGWGRDEVIGSDWISNFIPPEKREKSQDFLELAKAGTAPRHHRNEITTRTGEKRIIQWNNSTLRSASGAVIGLATIGEDVTNRVLAEREIIESEERLRIIIDASTDAVWEWNVADGTARWSDRVYSMLGYERSSFRPDMKAFREIIHPADIAQFDRSIVEHLENAVPFQIRLRLLHADGFHVPVLARGQLRRERAQMVGVFTDLSELERAEAHIREQAALIDQARDAIVVRDLDDHIVFWSKGAERLYGFSAGEAIGNCFDKLLHIEASRFEAAKRTAVAEGAWNGEMDKTAANGALIVADCRWTLLTDDRDVPSSILSIVTDVTARKSLEQQFFRAQRLESLGTLSGGIAHDLNNLLMPILMGVTLLKRLDPGERSLRAIRNIESSARRGAELVKQVLLFARGLEGSRRPLNVAEVVSEVEAILESTFPKNIVFETKVPSSLARVFGDATQLNQVLLNLCVNARDAMPDGGRLTVTALEEDVDLQTASVHDGAVAGRYVVIQVSDTGTGMSPEVIDRVFEPFFTTKELNRGTGLGLSTARGIVRSHGGFITVASRPGRGSSFCVHLPEHQIHDVSQKIETEIDDVTSGHGEVVLVVDDEIAILEVTRQALLAYGYQVMTAENGADAVSLFEREHTRIAVVVTDLMMPGMDGHTLIAALRSVDGNVPIVAMSGQIDSSIAPAADSAGATVFLSKPLTAGVMLRTLSRVLSDSTLRTRSAGSETAVPIPAPAPDPT